MLKINLPIITNTKLSGISSLLKSKIIISLMVVAIIFSFMYSFRDLFIAATVNGKPIFRWEVITKLEKTQGKAVLEQLLTETLIMQEAQRQKLTIPQTEINSEIERYRAEFKAQGQDFDKFALEQGLTNKDISQQLTIQKLVEKMFTPKTPVSDEEVQKYIDTNQSQFPANTDIEAIKPEIKNQLAQEQIGAAFETWLTKAKKDAQVVYFVKY